MKSLLITGPNNELMVTPRIPKRYSNGEYKVYGDTKGFIIVRKRDKTVAMCADWNSLGQTLEFNCKLIGIF